MTAPEGAARPSTVTRLLWPSAVCVITALHSLIPLLGSRDFYLRSDTTVQYAPTWFHLGEMVRAGSFPPTLDPDAWVGGNYAAEGLFGIYNPINWLIWLAVSTTDDLWVAVLVVKIATLMVLALGCYLLIREYGAAPWAAATLAVAIPWAGFTHYFDAAAFPAGLIAFAYAPWTWWAFRRTMLGRLNPIWAFVIGALAVTQGNPYGTLAVVVIGLGVICEGLATRNLAGVSRLAMTGACVASLLPLVYLPLIETAEVAFRADRPFLSDTGRLSPQPLDLLMSSNPGFVPDMVCGNISCRLPTVYICWFLLPLLPWLDWGALRRRLREHTSIAVVAVIYLVAMLGPSEVWFFRWPIRLSGYFLLALAIPFALMLSRGLRTDRAAMRGAITVALLLATIGVGELLDNPPWSRSLGGGVALALLTLVVVAPHLWRPLPHRVLAGTLLAGTTVVLLGQSLEYEENVNLRDWPVATDVSTLEARFGHLDGRVLQMAELSRFQDAEQTRGLGPADERFLPGSMYQVAGVEAVNNYSGMGFKPLQRFLCMHYEGSTDPCGFEKLWTPLTPDGATLADLMKLDTILVQSDQALGFRPPAGWTATPNGETLLLERTGAQPFEGSRLAWASPGADVTQARTIDDHHESVQVSAENEPVEFVFAMLDWPGYTAELDGEPVEVSHNEAGLLTVEIPAGATGELDVRYRPPGLTLGLWSLGVGFIGAIALSFWSRRRPSRDG